MVIGPAVQQALRDRARQMIALREIRTAGRGRRSPQERIETHVSAGVEAGAAITGLSNLLQVLEPREIRELVDAVERLEQRAGVERQLFA